MQQIQVAEGVLHFLVGGLFEYSCRGLVACRTGDLGEVAVLDMRHRFAGKCRFQIGHGFDLGSFHVVLLSGWLMRWFAAHGRNVGFRDSSIQLIVQTIDLLCKSYIVCQIPAQGTEAAMTLNELRFIVAVAQERNFRRAAEKAFISQPALSLAIQKLEEELGLKIFERGKNDVTPTPVGTAIVEQAQRVLEEAERIREIAARARTSSPRRCASASSTASAPICCPTSFPR